MLAILVGMVQGGTQALSRSLFASLIPRDKSGEFFGFFGVAEKFAGIFGPAIFGLINLLSGSSRGSILSIIAFFVVGGLLAGAGRRRRGPAPGPGRGGRGTRRDAMTPRDARAQRTQLCRCDNCFRQWITLIAHETPR